MTMKTLTRDPVQGLVDYVLDIKPYHTKILEIWVEYIHHDPINGKVDDSMEMEVHIDFDRRIACKYGWDTSPWDMFWNGNETGHMGGPGQDILEGNISYLDTGVIHNINKFDAYRLYFQYLTDQWKYRIGELLEPPTIPSIVSVNIPAHINNVYRVLAFPEVYNSCVQYWNVLTQGEWNDVNVDDDVIQYENNGVTDIVPRVVAYRTFSQYLSERWSWRNGQVSQPPSITSDVDNPYHILSFPEIMAGCTEVWRRIAQTHQFWLEPRMKRLYKFVGSRSNIIPGPTDAVNGATWIEQPYYYSVNEPMDAIEGEYWFSTNVSKLYARLVDGWVEINRVYMSYDVPVVPPTYPESWKSNWDYPTCPAPSGETNVHARVTDLLSFDHGYEIFLFDHARIAVVDPTGRDDKQNEFASNTQRVEHPIKFRTTVVQTSRNRYKLERKEISIVTAPDDPEILNTSWTIDLAGYDFDGWDIERVRKDVKLGEFITWTMVNGENLDGNGTKLIKNNLHGKQTFPVVVSNGVLQIVGSDQLTPQDCPWADGAIVYLRSIGDLPGYTLLTQDAHKPYKERIQTGVDSNNNPIYTETGKEFQTLRVERYRPYKIVREAGSTINFSLAIVDRKTLQIDTELMGTETQLTFTDGGTGDMFIGIGYPIPFMEIRDNFNDTIKSKRIKDSLSSSMEAFLGHKYLEIQDVLLGYVGDDDTTHNGFVVEGSFPKVAMGHEIRVANNRNNQNNGPWTVTHSQVWSNSWIKINDDRTFVPAPPPTWWDVTRMGQWPLPNKRPQAEIDELIITGQYEDEWSEYTYSFYTTFGVGGPAPIVTQKPHGYIVEDFFNFSDGSGKNKASTSVSDVLMFGSLRAVENADGTTSFVTEVGVPGVSVVLRDVINATIQEGIHRSDPYGGPTIGSYDITYFDQDTYDENLATIVQRTQLQ